MATSCICLIVKNEGPYLLEWIAYHRLLGFDEIVVYENNSDDNSADILCALARHKIIKYRPWRLGKNESPQITAYIDALKRNTKDWILFLDCDEFLVLHDMHLQTLLNSIDADPEIGAIVFNWKVFGSSGLEYPDGRLVIERFTMASEASFAMNSHVKTCLRATHVGSHIDMHMSDVRGVVVGANGLPVALEQRGRTVAVDHSVAQVNHYYTKTKTEYEVKRRRGQGGAGENSEIKYWYSDESFQLHDRNEIVDLSALRDLDILKEEIRRLSEICLKEPSLMTRILEKVSNVVKF